VDNRVCIGSVGVNDVLEGDIRRDISDLQKEDMLDFGRLLLALATRSVSDTAGISVS